MDYHCRSERNEPIPILETCPFDRLSAAIHCLFERVLTIFLQIPLVEDCEFTSETDRTLPIRLTELDYVKSGS